MSKKERLASSLDQLSDLCFTISELVISDSSEGEAAKPSTSALSVEAPAFIPSGKDVGASAIQGSKPSAISEDWENIPELPSVTVDSVDTPPTFSQVVGGSQSVYVTPVRAQSVDSVSSKSMANVQPANVPPVVQAPNYATCTGAQFDAYWNGLPTDAAKIAAETVALATGNDQVKLACLLHRDNRNQARLLQVTNQLGAAQAAAQNAQNMANAVAAAKASPPPKFENKEKDMIIRQWLPLMEEYLRDTPADQYLRMASSYLNGKPRSYWMSQYEAYHTANANQEPPNVRQFFRDTMIRGYGLRTPDQKYWDTWNKLTQGTGSVDDYNVAFEQALVDLAGQVTDEQVKIEHYRAGLQADLREMCRVSPADGTRWQTLNALMTYATLQWPVIESRLAKRKATQPTKVVGGKRKSSGGSPGRSSKARVSVVLTDEQLQYNMKHRLCHKCGKPGHIAADCTSEDSQSKGPGKGKQNKSGKDFQKA